jgi:hypothetical protein
MRRTLSASNISETQSSKSPDKPIFPKTWLTPASLRSHSSQTLTDKIITPLKQYEESEETKEIRIYEK